jgi:hypothetical protein
MKNKNKFMSYKITVRNSVIFLRMERGWNAPKTKQITTSLVVFRTSPKKEQI